GRDIAGGVISLGKLTHETIVELIRWALPSYKGESAERLARRIAAGSGGLPLLAVEICHPMAHGLDLQTTTGTWPHPLRTLPSASPCHLLGPIRGSVRVN